MPCAACHQDITVPAFVSATPGLVVYVDGWCWGGDLPHSPDPEARDGWGCVAHWRSGLPVIVRLADPETAMACAAALAALGDWTVDAATLREDIDWDECAMVAERFGAGVDWTADDWVAWRFKYEAADRNELVV